MIRNERGSLVITSNCYSLGHTMFLHWCQLSKSPKVTMGCKLLKYEIDVLGFLNDTRALPLGKKSFIIKQIRAHD